MVVGIRNLTKWASIESAKSGEQTANSIANAVSRVSELFSSDVDANPTITPVLDLSSFSSDVGLMNSMFGNRQVALAGNISGTIQNGSSLETTVSTLSRRLDDLTNTMNSRQMINYITIDGSSDPELFADRLVRKLKINMRAM